MELSRWTWKANGAGNHNSSALIMALPEHKKKCFVFVFLQKESVCKLDKKTSWFTKVLRFAVSQAGVTHTEEHTPLCICYLPYALSHCAVFAPGLMYLHHDQAWSSLPTDKRPCHKQQHIFCKPFTHILLTEQCDDPVKYTLISTIICCTIILSSHFLTSIFFFPTLYRIFDAV